MNNAANDNDAPTSLEDLVCAQCACCARDLTDAQSAERGIGPECFGRYYDKCAASADFVSSVKLATQAGLLDLLAALLDRQDARAACNLVVRAIAAQWEHPRNIERIELVRALGFVSLANRLEERMWGTPGIITITEEGETLVVKTRAVRGEALMAFVNALRAIPSRRYAGRGTNVVGVAHRAQLWAALQTHLPGRKLKSAKGESYVPGRVIRAADAA
jgi:hypothetical protein